MSYVTTAAIDISWVAGSLLAADFVTGLLHWAEDTWLAPGRNALLDRWIVIDNIEHHRKPGTIRAGHYWPTNRVCIAGAAAVAVVLAVCHVHAWQPYLILFLLSQSNQIHLWAHCSRPPRWVAALQRVGLLQASAMHAKHHKSPYAVNFCTMTNYLNPLLERIGFWRSLERSLGRLGATVVRGTLARGGY